MDLRHAAQLLGGEVSAGRILCPGPGHSRHDRSLSVRFSNNAPDGFLVQSFSRNDWQECKDHVRSLLGLEQFRPGEHRPDERPRFERPAEPTEDEKRNKERALAIWSEAVPIRVRLPKPISQVAACLMTALLCAGIQDARSVAACVSAAWWPLSATSSPTSRRRSTGRR